MYFVIVYFPTVLLYFVLQLITQCYYEIQWS